MYSRQKLVEIINFKIVYIVRARDDLTLFCDIYNVFMFLIDFFSAEFKSDEFQLEKFESFL